MSPIACTDFEVYSERALTLMTAHVPKYVVNYFIAAGYDTLGIIADMDVTDSPNNCMNVVLMRNIPKIQAILGDAYETGGGKKR